MWMRIGCFAFEEEGSWIVSGTLLLLLIASFLGISSGTVSLPVWVGRLLQIYLVVSASLWVIGPLAGSLGSLIFQFKTEDKGGFCLGTTEEGKAYFLTEKNLGYHVEIVAPTGSGKTTLLKRLIADRVQKGHGLIFIDYKAEIEMLNWFQTLAQVNGRAADVLPFSLAHPGLSLRYNPLQEGDAFDLHSLLMNSCVWSEPYYRAIASSTLMVLMKALCEHRDRTTGSLYLERVVNCLRDPLCLEGFLHEAAESKTPTVPALFALHEKLSKASEREKLSGFIANLEQLLESSAGPLLGPARDEAKRAIHLRRLIEESKIGIFMMNSLKLKESATVMGRIILQDLLRTVGDLYALGRPPCPTTLIIDEFAQFATKEFIELLDRARGAGIGIVVAHQSRADLRSVSPEFQERVEANCNTTIVSGVKSQADAEYYSGILGTRRAEKNTVQKVDGLLGDSLTGVKSVREVEEFVVHPNRLRELKQGELFVVSKVVDPGWGVVQPASVR